ncbi:MAG: hypothetical protein CL847_04005 [Crocinitomicaceae bacterium]|nr:hypothetical protein [Crocinitomicaceae bacterium]|tara:strand:+ start:875 stop:1495 length:621 start_codon:yes stop_codon:yes gene_type:complete
MPHYNIPDDFMNFSNEIYEPLYELLLADEWRGVTARAREIRSREEAKAGIHGLMGFFHEHDRNNLERMGIDGWMDNIENPDHDQVKREIIEDVTHVLKHFIDEHPDLTPDPNDPNDLRLAQTITDTLVRRFGIRAEGRKKPKKHTRHRTRRNGLKHKRSKHKRSKHNKTKHKGTKHKGTKHKETKHKGTKHKGTKHKGTKHKRRKH